jgi:hypothetical protein
MSWVGSRSAYKMRGIGSIEGHRDLSSFHATPPHPPFFVYNPLLALVDRQTGILHDYIRGGGGSLCAHGHVWEVVA